jgi:thymidine kinase
LEAECEFVEDFIARRSENPPEYDALIIDEAQFLRKSEVDFFVDIVDRYRIPVLCYGLRTDHRAELFEGSKRLFEMADVIEEVPTVCWCGKRAHFNARIHDGAIVRDGAQIHIGGNESYVSLCRRHYFSGQIHE